ncbi:MAG TPA: hypothetical protein PK359_03795 [Burkholderiaceae bacterium]|nr:hypothetical protein [Burkholderiaceae bacterium]
MKSAIVPVLCALVLAACVQLPTEKQRVVDTRPSISFRVDPTSDLSARVLVDGLDMGSLADFLDGAGSLRILSGTHVIKVIKGTDLLLNEKIYLGDGVGRTLNIK